MPKPTPRTVVKPRRLFHSKARSGYKRAPARRKRAYYAPNRKRRNVRRGNPIRETKTRSGEEVFEKFTSATSDVEGIDHPNRTTGPHGGRLTFWPTNSSPGIGGIVRVIPLYSLTHQQQGMDDDQMIGSSCFVKYMKLKGRVTWPSGSSMNLGVPCDLHVIHGFIKNSPNLNGRQSFRAINPQPENTFSALNMIQWTYDELQPYFDALSDDLKFIPKRESNLHILGNRKILPNLRQWTARQQTTDNTGSDSSVGTIPDARFSCNWPMMRKYHYETGVTPTYNTNTNAGNTRALQYINTAQWVPFCCLWAPQGGALLPTVDGEPGNLPTFQYNDQIWYTDP